MRLPPSTRPNCLRASLLKSRTAAPTVASLTAGSRLPALEAGVLLAHVLHVDRAWLAAHPGAEVTPEHAAAARTLFARRLRDEPAAYLVGEREFFGLAFRVTPDVLIPRPETELLVELALARMPPGQRLRVLDLGTGSGAIAVALALERPMAEVHASDASAAALAVAADNAARHGVQVRFVLGNWFEALPGSAYDLIVCNPPYVAEADAHWSGEIRFEPRLALEGGEDGLACIRAIVAGSPRYLQRGGWLLLEHGYDQGDACTKLLRCHAYVELADCNDLAGIGRVSLGRRD